MFTRGPLRRVMGRGAPTREYGVAGGDGGVAAGTGPEARHLRYEVEPGSSLMASPR